jgi:hypothetical protein
MGIVDPAVVHGQRKKPGRAERGRIGREFLDVPAERLFPLVNTEDRLECRRGFVGRRGVERDRVKRPRVEPPLICEVEDTTAFDCRERLDLADEVAPIGPGEAEQLLWRPAEELSKLEDQECPLHVGRRPRRSDAPAQLLTQRGEGTRVPKMLARCVSQGQPVEHEPDRQEFEQAPIGDRVNRPIAALLQEPDHAGPTAQGEHRGSEEVVPLRFGDAEGFERPTDRFERPDCAIAQSPQMVAQPA